MVRESATEKQGFDQLGPKYLLDGGGRPTEMLVASQGTQSQVGHTPGPWEVDYGGTLGHIKSVAERADGATPTICRYDSYAILTISDDEQEANARLIAAAPILLAALERIAEFNEQPFDDAYGLESISDQWNNKAGLINAIAQAAILRAKGGA